MRKSTEIINKEYIRGWFRNWLMEKYQDKKPVGFYHFYFDMESVAFDGGMATFVKCKKDKLEQVTLVTFFMDNIMRWWLSENDMKYVYGTKENKRNLLKFFNHLWKSHAQARQ